MPIPCLHIWAYYNYKWQRHHCIAYNLLRRGYRQCAAGIQEEEGNNLYG